MTDAHSADEPALVEAANHGDVQAFEELYRRHAGWALSLARRLTRSEQDALDVLQETFGYLWAKFPGFELRSTIRAFLYPVIKHTSADLLRRRRRDTPLEHAGEVETLAAADRPGATVEFLNLLEDLPEHQREVVVLRFAHDFRLAEIADVLEIPIGTVKSRLHNALEELRRRHARE